jgi:hypothetical protein
MAGPSDRIFTLRPQDLYRALMPAKRGHRAALRAFWGSPCRQGRACQPKRIASILMGGWYAAAQPCIENQVRGEFGEQGMQS